MRSAPYADPPLRIPSIEASGSRVTITWPAGPSLRLQLTTNLTSSAWQNVPATTGTDFTTLAVTNATAFFHLLGP